MSVVEGMILVEGGRVRYQKVGRPEGRDALPLPGRPSGHSEDRSPLIAFSNYSYPVVRSVEPGSRPSVQPDDSSRCRCKQSAHVAHLAVPERHLPIRQDVLAETATGLAPTAAKGDRWSA